MVVAFGWNKSAAQTLRVDEYNTTALQASSTSNPAIAFQCQGTNVGEMGTLRGGNGNETGGVPFIATSGVRRLTPRECERLQGFPNDYTLVQYRGKCSPDGPRYKALGNSMAVPVMRWIGERIQMVDLLEAA
jgi:DNA (cytosine-5)-methyltransferase 1